MKMNGEEKEENLLNLWPNECKIFLDPSIHPSTHPSNCSLPYLSFFDSFTMNVNNVQESI